VDIRKLAGRGASVADAQQQRQQHSTDPSHTSQHVLAAVWKQSQNGTTQWKDDT
jgi:hypothetical protein